MYICDVHKSSLRFHCQRFSNNSNPEFTDEEVLTIYLFCGYCQRYFNIKKVLQVERSRIGLTLAIRN